MYCSWFEPEEALLSEQAIPCVIYLHGNAGCRLDGFPCMQVTLPYNISFFSLDLSGSGKSEGTTVENCTNPEPEFCVHARDTHAALTQEEERSKTVRERERANKTGKIVPKVLSERQSLGEYLSLGYFEKDDVRAVVSYLRSTGKVSRIGK